MEILSRKPLIGSEELAAVTEVLSDGWLSCYRGGELESKGYVRKLEDAFCDYFNVKYAVAMNSATSCLHAACIACDVKDKEVITTPFTFSASASCILMAGGKVKFSDIEDTYYNINPALIKGNADTVIAVHLHGHPADMDNILGTVIEDASQSIGAKYKSRYVGTIGICGVFSLNQWKQITCGEGGVLITNDDNIAEKVRLVRNHGELASDTLGYNYRLTELNAAVAYEQFKKLDSFIAIRQELAEYLTEQIKDFIDTPKIAEGCTHTYYTYAIKTKERDRLQHELGMKGIYFGSGGLKPLHLIPFYGGHEGQFPIAERMYREMMFTDIIRPQATFKDMDYIAEGICRSIGVD